MRNIKFRGLGKNGKFVYGDLIQTKDHDGTFYSWIQEKSVLGLGALSNQTSRFTQVDSKTVGQATGWVDAKGFDVYEGDAVLATLWFDGVKIVKYESSMGFTPMHEPVDYDDIYMSESDIEVVGNIHQNPELDTPEVAEEVEQVDPIVHTKENTAKYFIPKGGK